MPDHHKKCTDKKITHVYNNTKKHCKSKPITPTPPVNPCNQPYIVNSQLNVTAPPCVLQDTEYRNLFNTLSEKILTYRFDLLLAAVHNEASYNRLLRAVREAQKVNGVTRYRFLITHPNGNVVIDTNQHDHQPHNPRSNSYQHYINGTIDENHNTRPEIMRAQAEQGGVGYNETTELDTITTPRKKVAIRLGRYLNAQGTIRINSLSYNTTFTISQQFGFVSTITPSISITNDGDLFSLANATETQHDNIVFYTRTDSTSDFAENPNLNIVTNTSLSGIFIDLNSNGSSITVSGNNGTGFTSVYYTSNGSRIGTDLPSYAISPDDIDLEWSRLSVLDDSGNYLSLITPNGLTIQTYQLVSGVWSNTIPPINSNSLIRTIAIDTANILTIGYIQIVGNGALIVNVVQHVNNNWNIIGQIAVQSGPGDIINANIVMSSGANTIAYTADGKLFYSDPDNGVFRVGRLLDVPNVFFQAVDISADGNIIVASGVDTIRQLLVIMFYSRNANSDDFGQPINLPRPVLVSSQDYETTIALARQSLDTIIVQVKRPPFFGDIIIYKNQ
jgi:hypothetical protein